MLRTLVILSSFAVVVAGAACAQSNGRKSACDRLLSPQEIAMATGLTVGKGQTGPHFEGARSSCIWQGSDGAKIVVMLTDTEPMQTTMGSMLQTGGDVFGGLGDVAVGTQGIPETGGGYNLSFVDPKGGVAVTIPGNAGTSDRTIALGQLIERRRNPSTEAESQPKHGLTAQVF